MNHTIEDLRRDLENLSTLHRKSPLYLEIKSLTNKVYSRLKERLNYDQFGIEESLNSALIYLTQPMSGKTDVSPLEHYLVFEYNRRKQIGDSLSIEELRKILYTSIKNHLLKPHTSSYVEALVTRTVDILKARSSVSISRDGSIFETVAVAEPIVANASHILTVANKCSVIEKIPQRSETRNSIVYSPENLLIIVETLISEVNKFHREDLFDLFQKLLTNWLPKSLSTSDESASRAVETNHSSEAADVAIGSTEYVYQNAHRIWSELSKNQRRFLHANTWEVTHAEIAQRVLFIDNRNQQESKRYKRVWVVNLQVETLSRLKEMLEDLDPDEHIEIIHLITEIATFYEF